VQATSADNGLRTTGWDSGVLEFGLAMKNHELRWDSALKEWYCTECGSTSKCVGKLSAMDELSKVGCSTPQNRDHPGKPR